MSRAKKSGMGEEFFRIDGKPQVSRTAPLALQHVVAMIVGCVTPAIIVAGVAGLSDRDSVLHWIRTSGDYGNQFCLRADNAGDCGRV